MFPKLFEIGSVEIYSYGFMIMTGALLGFAYLRKTAVKELQMPAEKIQTLGLIIIISAFVGGKIFFYLEKPSFYFNPPSNMLHGLRTGFVFYGSLLTALPLSYWYFRKEKWPVWPMMDLLSITAAIIHVCGRMGCFLAGCCHGLPSDVPWAVTFTLRNSSAKPLFEPLHPTQLYSVALIGSILLILFILKRHKRFEGQLFFIYMMLYAAGRAVIEIYRGDLRRGFIIEDWLSHSQLISVLIIAVSGWMYCRFSKKAAH